MKLTERLEQALYDVIDQEQFDDVTIIEVLGIFEGIKWHLIQSVQEDNNA